jgi:hypothetical protein
MEQQFSRDQHEAMENSYVLAFAGHMIDDPKRLPPRFPSEAEPALRQEIGQNLFSSKQVHTKTTMVLSGTRMLSFSLRWDLLRQKMCRQNAS